MAGIEDMYIRQSQGWGQLERLVRRVLLVPEAVILLGLLLIAWRFRFPPLISLLIIMTACIFGVRLGLITLAERYLDQGAYRRADHLVRTALRLHPWSSDALLLRAQGLVQQGQDEAAIEMLRYAALLSPDDHQLQGALAATLLAQGRISEGWRLLEAINHPVTSSPVALQQLAWIALRIDNDPVKAIALIAHIDLKHLPPPSSTPLLIILCDALIASGAYDEALRFLRYIEGQLQACGPTQQAELLYHLGRLYRALGHDGSSYFRRSVQLDPQGRYALVAWRCAMHSSFEA
jgi:Tfp pilus assembly protein PilF